ncbi:MAG: hypothetical protein WCI74_09265, partial [Actinomycetes bacterium]
VASGRVSGPTGQNGQGGPGGLSGQGGPDGLGDQSQGQGQEGLGGNSGNGGGTTGRGGVEDLLTQLFNSDGSINSDAVQQLLQQFGSGNGPIRALPMLIQRAVASGLITQAQADALLAALGTSATPDTNTGPNGASSNDWAPPSQGRTGASGA